MFQAFERYDFADKAMESFWSLYESELDWQRIDLIRRLGFSANTLNFVLDSNSYYIPNIRAGRVTRPKSVSKSAIAVVAAYSEEDMELTQPTLHELQRDRLTEELDEQPWLKEAGLSVGRIDSELKHTELRASLSADTDGCVSSALSPHYPHRKKKDVLVRGRPFVTLNMSPGEPCPSVFAHELTHVAQRLDRPMQIFDRNQKDTALKLSELDDELQGYSVQANMFWSVPETLASSMDTALAVDGLRKRYIGSENYHATLKLRKAIMDDSIACSIL